MKQKVLKVHPKDNVLVALQDLSKGENIVHNGNEYTLKGRCACQSISLLLPTSVQEML